MRTSNKETRLSLIPATVAFLLILFTSISVLAQNVSDSDLSNSAGTNKNWFGSWWLIALLIMLIVVLFMAYSRRKNRRGEGFTNEKRPD